MGVVTLRDRAGWTSVKLVAVVHNILLNINNLRRVDDYILLFSLLLCKNLNKYEIQTLNAYICRNETHFPKKRYDIEIHDFPLSH